VSNDFPVRLERSSTEEVQPIKDYWPKAGLAYYFIRCQTKIRVTFTPSEWLC
jgi:hypothetical protein